MTDLSICAREPLPQVVEEVKVQKASPFGAKTYLGCKYDEVSSAMQKACRRGYEDEARQWAVDMYLSGPHGSTLHTNTWNRLLTVAVEDVGPADANAILFVMICREYDRAAPNVIWIAVAVTALARCKKTRINDWMTAVYQFPNVTEIPEPRILVATLANALATKNRASAWYCADALWHRFLPRSRIYGNASSALGGTKKGQPVNTSIPSTNTENMKAFYAQPAFLVSSYVERVREVGMDKNWVQSGKHRLLLLHIINLQTSGQLASLSGKIDFASEIKVRGIDMMKCQESVNLVKKRDSSLLGMPDYAIDKHTARGKKLGRGLDDFLKTGALLNNVDERWEKFSPLYIEKFWKGRAEEKKLKRKSPRVDIDKKVVDVVQTVIKTPGVPFNISDLSVSLPVSVSNSLCREVVETKTQELAIDAGGSDEVGV